MDKRPANDKPEILSDELLNKYLDGETRLSQVYRELGQAEPPAALDRAILDEARQKAGTQAGPAWIAILDPGKPEFWSRWMRPLTAVITMGVCLAVVLQIMDSVTVAPEELLSMQTAPTDMDYVQRAAQPEEMPRALQGPPPAAPDRAASTAGGEAAVVSRRKRSEQLQDIPLTTTVYSAADSAMHESAARTVPETAVSERQTLTNPDDTLADNALEAWASGTRPAANVWLAGIQALLAHDPAYVSRELDHMALVYPDAVEQFRQSRQAQPGDLSAATAEQKSAARLSGATEIMQTERPAGAPDPAGTLADPWVWAAGINWLHATGAEAEAEAEQAKFRLIYPNFQL